MLQSLGFGLVKGTLNINCLLCINSSCHQLWECGKLHLGHDQADPGPNFSGQRSKVESSSSAISNAIITRNVFEHIHSFTEHVVEIQHIQTTLRQCTEIIPSCRCNLISHIALSEGSYESLPRYANPIRMHGPQRRFKP